LEASPLDRTLFALHSYKPLLQIKKQYEAAIAAFQERYFQLPGDMTNATDFWGETHTTASTCATTASTGEETCDGDGSGTWLATSNSHEGMRLWQHLANAGLIEGSYSGTGVTTTSGAHATNSPTSPVSNGIWWAWSFGDGLSGHGSLFDGNYNNVLAFGGILADSEPLTSVLTTEEAWNFDKKSMMANRQPVQPSFFITPSAVAMIQVLVILLPLMTLIAPD
jgi:hypothetical protein